MPRAGYKPDPETFEIVDWIIERVHFELAAVTRTSIDGADAQGSTEYLEDAFLQHPADTQSIVTRWRRLGRDPGTVNLS